ncbi:cytochrome c oxidase subunit VIa [Verticillium alfalfae VaMs.102]|uniref:Cytochrome c oxidase subunit VIa n=1 Tax=Verticillium alfalfae (strain VaMs.102 / ATCC MYA-4576 / FGSC 10136) TaxID=526221 RepID=C9SBZ5_VERA1|nr:cytochrome c oxidase subunit VIa [Verticillium alfalfae VaMs.102]EEY15879.1 cytochrome c oxidase subunit VIa [Verticillium alfalfae VaMs.102]
MLPQRQILRAAPRFAAQLRAPTQRRLASSAGENAFISERQHAKEHASGTTGPSLSNPFRETQLPFACIPALGLAGWNAYSLWNEHWEHWSHMLPLEERTEYSYQNIRTKNFSWGNGDKTIFWNDDVNYHNKDK